MKDSNVEWIGQIPDDWSTIRFKDKYVNQKVIAGQKSVDYERLALTLNGVIKRAKDDSEGLQPKEFDGYQIIYENDFIFKMIDLQNISTSRVGLSPYVGLVSPAYIRFSPRMDNQYNKFVYYFLMSMYYNCVYNNLAGNGVRSALNATDMGQFVIPYPSIDIQRKIVNLLENKLTQIDTLIANQQAQIEKLKEYKQAIITEAVTKGLDKTASMKDSGVEWIGEIPEDWCVKPIKSLFSFGKGLPITKADLRPSGIKTISYGQVHAKYNKSVFIDEQLYRFVESKYLQTNADSLVKKGDFIFADTSEDIEGSGDFVYIDIDDLIFAGYHSLVLKSLSNFENKFLAYLFMSLLWKRQLWREVYGIKVFSITRSLISKTTVILPTLTEQQVIVNYLDNKCADIDSLISIKQQKIEKLQEYKKSLIYEYVTGKKEVV